MAAVRPHAEDATTIDFAVEGMTCGSCAARVQRVLAKADGVAGAEVNFATGRAHVTLERPVPAVELQARVERIGYGLTPVADTPRRDDPDERARRSWLRRYRSGHRREARRPDMRRRARLPRPWRGRSRRRSRAGAA